MIFMIFMRLCIFYTVRPPKSLHFLKVPHINISKYIQDIFIHVGSYGSLLSNDTKISDDIVCLSEQEPRLWNRLKSRLDRDWYICFGYYQQTWESWKGFEIFIFWWSDDNLWTDRLCCVFILTRTIGISCFIEQFITLLTVLITSWCVL